MACSYQRRVVLCLCIVKTDKILYGGWKEEALEGRKCFITRGPIDPEIALFCKLEVYHF